MIDHQKTFFSNSIELIVVRTLDNYVTTRNTLCNNYSLPELKLVTKNLEELANYL